MAAAQGLDGMTGEAVPGDLQGHWPQIREAVWSGGYEPQPVKRVQIPKPGGGVRNLGMPTGLERVIQQALVQVRQPEWERTFSEQSDGFRPRRSAHQALAQAQRDSEAGWWTSTWTRSWIA